MDLDASNYVNDSSIEMSWAIAAYDHAETHFSLLCVVPDCRQLRLSSNDDLIYKKFRQAFPDLEIEHLSEEMLKSPEQKELWRPFCMEFEGVIEDFNQGTLLRLDANKGYDEANTCVVPRIQFLAIEIARNRQGLNDRVKKTAVGS
ncbi:polysaccharide biosynthesis domain containing protein 1 [Sparganum proliferum]